MTAFHFEIREPWCAGKSRVLDPLVASALIDAITDFATETGVAGLEISYAELNMPIDLAVHFGMVLETAVAIDLLRRELSEAIGWFMLRDKDRFYVHSGQEVHFFIGSAVLCKGAVRRAREAGLEVWEYGEPSQYKPYCTDPAELGQLAAADLWQRLSRGDREYLVLERFAMNLGGLTGFLVSDAAEVQQMRASLRPHSALAVLEVADLLPASDISEVQLTEWEESDTLPFDLALAWPSPQARSISTVQDVASWLRAVGDHGRAYLVPPIGLENCYSLAGSRMSLFSG